MIKKNLQKIIKYWLETAEHDYETMRGLFKIKRYSDCLFYGHIVLEKVLKALVVKNTKEQAPRLHDLVRLHDLAELSLSEPEVLLLKEINGFNIRSRYPDFKLQFYKMCTPKFTAQYFKKIIFIYNKLCREFKLKK